MEVNNQPRGKAEVVKTATVYRTMDHNMFVPFRGQPVDRAEKNYKVLESSIVAHQGNIDPIIVNSNFEVIDGNTRLYALKKNNLPVLFEMRADNENGISDEVYMQEKNTSQKQMTQIETVESLARMNSKEYKDFKDLFEFYKGLELPFSLAMLTKLEPKIRSRNVKLRDIHGIDYARLKRKILTITKVYKAFGNLDARLSPLNAEMDIVMKIGRVDVTRLITKIKKHSDMVFKKMTINKMTDRSTTKRFLEKVYNYGETGKGGHKVDIYKEYSE